MLRIGSMNMLLHGVENPDIRYRDSLAQDHAGEEERYSPPPSPIALQRAFTHRVAAVEKLKAAHGASLAEIDALFASLQHRAFRGEL